ncbi:hypothetical protein MTR_3g451330 [Medicago truncatula]|uniref:RNase H type-1 domain-containing protein n=1 Tax=Medicago truncatula TaxID=3880 RepID=A0A072V6B6_MEDTR|nr:hypothetical protein MTR_3g451330 [Medicago truncatula]
MRNRWDKARHRGIQVLSSHTFREGNYCADKLAGMGHTAHDTVWFSTLPHEILILKASPLRYGVDRGLSSITFGPARAAANDLVVTETGGTVAVEADCTADDVEALASRDLSTKTVDAKEGSDPE